MALLYGRTGCLTAKNGGFRPGQEDIDTRLKYLFRMRIRLGHFDPPGPLQQIPTSAICTPETIELARDGTRQGSVLLKNAMKVGPALSRAAAAVCRT
jgi:beta-glucosidase-like glycosyl hydrolase